jgi:hypothetical protein
VTGRRTSSSTSRSARAAWPWQSPSSTSNCHVGSTAPAPQCRALGAIFLLQAVSLLLNGALDGIAFKILGQAPEGILPIAILFWFAALLVYASRGRTRLIGWLVVPPAIVLTVAMVIAHYVGIEAAYLKLAGLLPFAWLLLESVKPASAATERRGASGAEVGAAAAS